jgi:hypothetical protein
MEEAQKAKLMAKIETGSVMRQFMNHPGFAIWHKDLQDKIDDVRKEWLTTDDPAKAERIRTRALQLNEALDLIKRRVMEGDNASKLYNAFKDENQAPA